MKHSKVYSSRFPKNVAASVARMKDKAALVESAVTAGALCVVCSQPWPTRSMELSEMIGIRVHHESVTDRLDDFSNHTIYIRSLILAKMNYCPLCQQKRKKTIESS